jgi:hypothetical protein
VLLPSRSPAPPPASSPGGGGAEGRGEGRPFFPVLLRAGYRPQCGTAADRSHPPSSTADGFSCGRGIGGSLLSHYDNFMPVCRWMWMVIGAIKRNRQRVADSCRRFCPGSAGSLPISLPRRWSYSWTWWRLALFEPHRKFHAQNRSH